jgi:integrase
VLLIVGELAEIIERRLKMRRLDCPYIFHADGRPIGDFRKRWRKGARPSASGRIVHDLRRSGVRHLIRAGVPPHTVMAFSGHRTPSMLKRYDIIALDDLRAAAEKGSAFAGVPGEVVPMRTRRERAE